MCVWGYVSVNFFWPWSKIRLYLSKCLSTEYCSQDNEPFLLVRRCKATHALSWLSGKLGPSHNEEVFWPAPLVPNPARPCCLFQTKSEQPTAQGFGRELSTVQFGAISFNSGTNSSLKCTICRPPKHFIPSSAPHPPITGWIMPGRHQQGTQSSLLPSRLRDPFRGRLQRPPISPSEAVKASNSKLCRIQKGRLKPWVHCRRQSF